MIEQVAKFLLAGGELIVYVKEDGYDRYLVIAVVDEGDYIRNEVVLSVEDAEILFDILLDFVTEG